MNKGLGLSVGQRGGRRTEKQPAAGPLAASPSKAADPRPLVEVFDDIEQGSHEWHELRRGIPTASRFGPICAVGKDGSAASSLTRAKLLKILAGEILSGEIAETFRSDAMGRGSAMEAEAREHYERTRLVEIERVGFIRRKLPSGRWVGCSPDGFVKLDGVTILRPDGEGPGRRRALEIKTTRPDLLIDILDKGAAGFPSEHRAQLQGSLWIMEPLGVIEIDLHVYYRGMRAATFLMQRDEPYIRDLSHSVEVFDWELYRLVERMKND